MTLIKIYTDGAYASSRDQGGWAFVVLHDEVKIFSNFGTEKETTNNRMEIWASYEAIKWAKENNHKEITIVSDSMYVIGTMSKGYKRNKNHDLWEQMDQIVKDIEINWTHVKGHSGDKYNDLCDALAVEGSKV